MNENITPAVKTAILSEALPYIRKFAGWTIVIKYGGKRLLSSVKNEFSKYGMEKRFIDTCNERAMLRYLIHLDNPEKYQYSKNDVDTNMKSECDSAWSDDVTSVEALTLLTKYIQESESKISYADLTMYAIKNNLTKGLKVYGYQVTNILREHNNETYQNDFIKKAHDDAIIS